MFDDTEDRTYTMFSEIDKIKKINFILEKRIKLADEKIKKLEDYIEKSRLPEYMVLRPKQKDFNVTVLGQANGSPCSGLYVYNERTK